MYVHWSHYCNCTALRPAMGSSSACDAYELIFPSCALHLTLDGLPHFHTLTYRSIFSNFVRYISSVLQQAMNMKDLVSTRGYFIILFCCHIIGLWWGFKCTRARSLLLTRATETTDELIPGGMYAWNFKAKVWRFHPTPALQRLESLRRAAWDPKIIGGRHDVIECKHEAQV